MRNPDRAGRERGPEVFSTLLADLREVHQRLVAANERLTEMREQRTRGDAVPGRRPEA